MHDNLLERIGRGMIACACGLGACGTSDDTAEDSGNMATDATGSETAASTGDATQQECDAIRSKEACDAVDFCGWQPTYYLPADDTTCALDQSLGGVCFDYSTSDGCMPGVCGGDEVTVGPYDLAYREVEGGYEVVRSSECNGMHPDFTVCPVLPGLEDPAPCSCPCT